MRTSIIILCMSALAIAGRAEAKTYQFASFIFNGNQTISEPASSGQCQEAVCKLFFERLILYEGKEIRIPNNARIFGVSTVSDGESSRIVPLFEWTDKKGIARYGCNGPSPEFALTAKDRKGLIVKLEGVLRGK